MSIRSASVEGLRSGARSLRTAAGSVGLAGWSAGQRTGVAASWWGPHADRWSERCGLVADAARATEAVLRSLATATERYADDVEIAQSALDRLDRQADALRVRAARDLEEWRQASGEDRGPRPSHGEAFRALDLERLRVEEQAAARGRAYGHAVDAAVERLPSLPSLRSVITPPYLYGYSLPSGAASVADAPHSVARRQRSLLPQALRGPLNVVDRFAGPVRLGMNVDVLVNGSGKGGARGAVDRGMALLDSFAVVGVYVGAGGAALVGGVTLGQAALAAGVVTGGYVVVTTAYDHRPRGRRRPPRDPRWSTRPGAVGPRTPVLRPGGEGLRPPVGPPAGFTTVRPVRVGPVAGGHAPAARGPRPRPVLGPVVPSHGASLGPRP